MLCIEFWHWLGSMIFRRENQWEKQDPLFLILVFTYEACLELLLEPQNYYLDKNYKRVFFYPNIWNFANWKLIMFSS